jgi:hypothetical protein
VDEAHPPSYTRVGVDRQTNPSIHGEDVLVREVNYELSPEWKAPEGYLPDTKNYLGRLRARKVENLALVDDNPRSLIYRNGLEDGRLIRWNGRLYGLFTGHYQTGGRWVVFKNTMVLWDFESKEYRAFPTGRIEKNWMPFVEDGHLRVVYSTSPLVILDISEVLPEVVWEGPGLTESWSGGSQMVPYQGGYLGVVHRHKNRVYEHAFLGMDKHSVELSPPFRFFGESVEFCAGLDLTDGMCLSFGVQDKEGYLLWVGSGSSTERS